MFVLLAGRVKPEALVRCTQAAKWPHPTRESTTHAESHSSNTVALLKVSQDLLAVPVLTTQATARQTSQLLSGLTENLK
jgi:hypothetical protein